MKQKMKSYVWEDVFADYTPGMAVALATSLEESIDKLAEGEFLHKRGVVISCPCSVCTELLRAPHKVFDADREDPVGFYVCGGG